MTKEFIQLKKIQEIFTFINAHEFNEIKKQVNKYKKSKRNIYQIFYYIAFNKYLLDNHSKFANIDTNSHDEDYIKGIRYELSLYIKKLIALYWYLDNGKDYIHKYQIQMLYENFKVPDKQDNIDRGRKFYIKALKLNRSVGENNKNYIPLLDIVGFGNENYENNSDNKENDIINKLIDEMIYFIPYYQAYKLKGKKQNLEWIMVYHPMLNIIKESYYYSCIDDFKSIVKDEEW